MKILKNVNFKFPQNADRPGPPDGIPVIEEVHQNNIKLSWKPPLDDGGSPITGYIIEKCDLTTGLWRRAGTSRNTQTSVEFLEEHHEFRFRVRAENLYGTSEPGAESGVIVTQQPKPDIDYDELGELLPLDQSDLFYTFLVFFCE